MLLDIVILPPAAVRKSVAMAAKKYATGFKPVFVVDNKKLIPHVSLFHLKMNKNKLPKLEKMVKKIISGYTPFLIKSSKVSAYNRAIWFYLKKDDRLRVLHRQIFIQCSLLRDGQISEIKKTMPILFKKYIVKYGSYYVEKNFLPHFSLVQFHNNNEAMLAMDKGIKSKKIKFVSDAIAICEIDKNGQVTKVLKQFKM